MDAFERAARASEDVNKLRSEVAHLQALIGSHQIAVQSICGAILQIAKQGISIVHGNLANAPSGRALGGAYLRDVVWQARNQAMHCEEGNFSPPVVRLFRALEARYGRSFSLESHAGQSRAKQVIDLLEWKCYSAYLSDARQLGL